MPVMYCCPQKHEYIVAERDCGNKHLCPICAAATLHENAERQAMILAAVSTASRCNTRRTAAEQRISRDNPYWTQAYEDVCTAVGREIQERERAEAAESRIRELEAALATAPERRGELATEGYRIMRREYDALLRKYDALEERICALEGAPATAPRCNAAPPAAVVEVERAELIRKCQEQAEANETMGWLSVVDLRRIAALLAQKERQR